MASIWTLQFRTLSVPPSIVICRSSNNSHGSGGGSGVRIIRNGISKWCSLITTRSNQLRQDSVNSVAKFHNHLFTSILNPPPPPLSFLVNGDGGMKYPIWMCVVALVLFLGVRAFAERVFSQRNHRPGSVADLVRRGQLRSDRRGISRPLKYEDPFNNPMVKVGKSNSTVEMCGKVYRLAPVTLTEEQQAIHQRRRSRAYQWKRPTMFLREGDTVPPDADPDTIRWIPANHPFATTATDLDEDLAQNNVYQKHGVPFRIQAEHEALQRKLEALQNEQKLKKVVIDPATAREFERPFNSHAEKSSVNNQVPESKPSKSDIGLNSLEGKSSSQED
ncbi:protein MULTIPLE CHLOROPLAST DIVISION SITE 1 [Arachis ipaensis]|uniref:Protein MULTIPLE CHLOROPLAST DIVISION SITE 1 n=1 Tax=Arachis hypogaea TaxID=3818 RepID=A0A445CD36_ARAHY|nr:protein MULTIPLE CHLOROPLAST DIVISION SITE 1 [Arachis ipaensis]QHN93095.1 uncharacterized protein DS421_17g589740 [Arachis hypogaea]RYR48850.1 hypothetical protein Ahy_A07g034924 [Arachis hypogaea]